MRNSAARNIIRQRRARNMILPYIEHINLIIKVQGQVRVFIAKKKLKLLKDQEYEIDREIACNVIQKNARLFLLRKKNNQAKLITRFIRRLPVLRNRRLRVIKENISRIRIQQTVRRWLHRNRYVELPHFHTNLNQPAQERIQSYINDRTARREARQHNWNVLNRRLHNIRRDIDDIIRPERDTRAITARPLHNNIIDNPGRLQLNTRLMEDFNSEGLVPLRERPRNREIFVRNPTPPLVVNRENANNDRLREIENQFQDPRVRAIYQNNRIILPDGNRIIPAPNGRLRLEPDPDHIANNLLPNTPTVSSDDTQDCPICLEKKPTLRMLDTGCQHSMCYRCAQGMIIAALKNVTTNIPIKCHMSSSGCENIITPYTEGVRLLLSQGDYEKFEKYHILKSYVPANRLRYCPNSNCGMPFEVNDDIVDELTSPPSQISFRLSTCCNDCDTLICIYCNDFAHPNVSCKDFQQRLQDGSHATSEYIKNYCKKCPMCKVNVQKQQTQEQEHHEKMTGMAGGTSECHHVTCGACKGDFCWTCLKTYSGATYYHRTCPNNDCTITFLNGVPNISHLPVGQYMYIKMVLYDKNNSIEVQRVFQINNSRQILGANPNQYTIQNKTVVVHCNSNGIVKRLEGLLGDYTFRQNTKLC